VSKVSSGAITAICLISSIVFLYKTFEPEIEGGVSGTAAAAQGAVGLVDPILAICLAAVGIFFLIRIVKK